MRGTLARRMPQAKAIKCFYRVCNNCRRPPYILSITHNHDRDLYFLFLACLIRLMYVILSREATRHGIYDRPSCLFGTIIQQVSSAIIYHLSRWMLPLLLFIHCAAGVSPDMCRSLQLLRLEMGQFRPEFAVQRFRDPTIVT